MKKPFIIVASSVLVLSGVGVVLFLLSPRPPSLQSSLRREWKQKRIAEISARIADVTWSSNELARLTTAEPGRDDGWLSDTMIRMRNGDWLAYVNICQKRDPRIHDLFLARGSDGQWYYSTYHFCVDMIALRIDEQPEDLAGFKKTYFLRKFDGQSDDCLQKTWPLRSRWTFTASALPLPRCP